jgi:rhamnosyltransferase
MTSSSILGRYRHVRNPLRHLGYKLAEIVGGTLFLSRPGQMVWRARLGALAPAAGPAPERVGLIAHVYYAELFEEILACWRACPDGAALHVTAPESVIPALRAHPGFDSRITLHPSENRGRDIAPFLSVLGSGALDGYDAVLKIHTKRSTHLMTGELRRKLLLATLAGDPRQVLRIAGGFSDPKLGLAGFGGSLRRHPRHWGENRARVEELVARMAASAGSVPDTGWPLAYFEGSMFWFRPAAFRLLRGLDLTSERFEVEQGQLDGMLHHAVERLFIPAAAMAGYQTHLLGGRSVSSMPGSVP